MREAELAARMRVSRTPIREAIRRLVSDGLVEVAPSRGVMVVQLDRQQVRELYALREALEGTAARLAAQAASPAEIDEMSEVLNSLTGRDNLPDDLFRANSMFHGLIYEAARNRYLEQALAQLSDSLALLPGTTFGVAGRQDVAMLEHLAILRAIAARDSETAEQTARHHIRMAGQVRLRMMFEPDRTGPE